MTILSNIINIILIAAIIWGVYKFKDLRVSGVKEEPDPFHDELEKLVEQLIKMQRVNNVQVADLKRDLTSRILSLEKLVDEKEFTGIVETNLDPVLKKLEEVKSLIEVKEDAPLHFVDLAPEYKAKYLRG